MATTGCTTAGSSTPSSMRQLHPLRCKGASALLSHPCKMGSLVLFVFLPTRFNPISCKRQRMRLSPSMCGHGDLEIVSVRELADGFLHFAFGTPSNVSASSKVDELSSSCGEHLAGKLSVPCRPPSTFSKKSPIPVAAVWQRKRSAKKVMKQGSPEATPISVKEAMTSSSRPKSYFIKRSPIPLGRSVQSLQSEVLDEANAVYDGRPMPQRSKNGSVKRPPSAFVRKSPVPQTARDHVMSPLPSSNPDSLSDKAGQTAVRTNRKSVVVEASRPKSVFLRRSPIVKVQKLPSLGGTSKPLQPSDKKSEDAIVKSKAITESSSHDDVDLQKCKLAELKTLAKIKGLKGYSKLKKGELLNLLQNLDS